MCDQSLVPYRQCSAGRVWRCLIELVLSRDRMMFVGNSPTTVDFAQTDG